MIFHFDVFTAPHDDVKAGRTRVRRSRVIVEADSYPTAMDTAGVLAASIHGGMPTAVLVRY